MLPKIQVEEVEEVDDGPVEKVGYDFRLADLPIRTQINFTNATDERYFPSSYGSSQRIAQGAPRNVLASINVSF